MDIIYHLGGRNDAEENGNSSGVLYGEYIEVCVIISSSLAGY